MTDLEVRALLAAVDQLLADWPVLVRAGRGGLLRTRLREAAGRVRAEQERPDRL